MDHKSLINQLELAYAPLTAFEFAIMKDDSDVEKALEKASLYIIGQRPVITFENVVPDESEYQLNFEIHQKGNPNILKCKLPLIQEIVGSTNDDFIYVAFNNLDKSTKQKGLPFFNIHGFSLCEETEDGRKFLIWFSPEKFLQNYYKGYIKSEIVGDFRSFMDYKVHYVGKATKQSIFKRLTGHSTFQDILSLESSVTEKQLPANEIVILCFEFRENLQIHTFGDESSIESMVAAFQGKGYTEQERVFLDVEKALIKAMKPAYNKELFNNYPKSKDGLHADKYNSISYSFSDPICLKYNEGNIVGGLSPSDRDFILILDNKELKLTKYK